MLFKTKKEDNKIEKDVITNDFTDKSDGILLCKLRCDLNELKKLKPKEPCLRFILNDFLLKHGYDKIPAHMRLFEDFFGMVDRDWRYDFSMSQRCKVDELNCVIEILQNYRNEVSEMYDVMKRESKLREEVVNIKKALNIE